MYLDSAKKQEIFGTYGTSNTDTGSAESQIALFSYRIAHLTEHLKANRKDYSTQRALTTLVGKRRALLNYLKDRDIERSPISKCLLKHKEQPARLLFFLSVFVVEMVDCLSNADFITGRILLWSRRSLRRANVPSLCTNAYDGIPSISNSLSTR